MLAQIGNAEVVVGGQRYHQFVSLTVQRSKDDLTASGTLVLSWPGAEQFNAQNAPAQEMVDGAEIAVWLEGQKVCTGRIDKRSSTGSPEMFTLNLSFRGKAAALVDSSADHESGQENKKTPGDIVKKLADGYESQVTDKSGETRQLTRFVVAEGETVERAIRRATREFGLIVYEDENGDIVIDKREGSGLQGSPLVLGYQFTNWSVSRDIAPRYSKVTVKGDTIATDEKYGKDAEVIAAQVIDKYVQFKKELRLFAEEDQDTESLKARAMAEASRRAGKGVTVSITMSTWSDATGRLWTPGTIHHVTIPVDQVDDDLEISTVTFNLDGNKLDAQITLVMPETYQSSGGGGAKTDTGKAATKTKATKTKASGGTSSSFLDLNLSDPTSITD